MNNDELEMLLLSTSTSRQLIFNFMKGISLAGAALYLRDGATEKDIKTADIIMNNIIEGYQNEDHSIQ